MESLKYYSSHVFQRFTFSWIMLLCFITLGAGFSNVMAQELTVAGTLTAACAQKVRISIGEAEGNVTYKWEINKNTVDDPDWQLYTETDLNGETIYFEDTGELVGVDPGYYRVTATDDATGDTVTRILQLSEPYDLRAQIDFSGLICQNDENSGLALIKFINGPPPMEWTLTGSGVSLEGQETGSYLSIQDLNEGSYTLNWQSADECTGEITFNIETPSAITGFANVIDNVSCPSGDDGQVELLFSGGWEENEDNKFYFTEVIRDGVLVQNWSTQKSSDGVVLKGGVTSR